MVARASHQHESPCTTIRRSCLLLAFILPSALSFFRIVPAQSWGRVAPLSMTEGGSSPRRMTITEQLKYSPNRWKRAGEDLEPGVGGIWPGRPDAKKYKVTIYDPKTGVNQTLDVPEDRYIFWEFEEAGIEINFANGQRMCRNGCCTTCAVKLKEGKVKMEAALGLLRDMKRQGYALSCCALPRSDIYCELQNEDEVYIKQWGRPSSRGA